MKKGTRIFWGVVLLSLIVLFQALFVVREHEMSLVIQFGEPKRTITDPGLNVKWPFIQNVLRFDRQVLTTDAPPTEYITLDKKRVMIDQVSRWRIEDPLTFYKRVQEEHAARSRLNSIIAARLREEIARHDFLDLLRKEREEIMKTVTNDTSIAAQEFGIDVLDVRIKRVDLPQEVQASVFDRMRAERQRIAKRYRAEGEERARAIRAQAEREVEVLLAEAYQKAQELRGQGEAEAIAIYAQAFKQDPELFSFLRRLETYEVALREGTTLVLDADSDLLRYLRNPEGRKR